MTLNRSNEVASSHLPCKQFNKLQSLSQDVTFLLPCSNTHLTVFNLKCTKQFLFPRHFMKQNKGSEVDWGFASYVKNISCQ